MTITFVPRDKPAHAAPARLQLHAVLRAGALASDAPPTPIGATLRIGREVSGPDALAIPDDNMLSRLHSTLRLEGGQLVVTDHSSNGTFVNGSRVEREALRDRDVLRLGQSVWVVRVVDERPGADAPVEGLRGASREVRRLRATVQLMGPTSSTVLLLGETGTGKEVVARALHERGPRGPRAPFVAVNCAAVPEALAESLLFGHTAGAFTGAKGSAPGAFRAAHGGTLFLDELGELPLGVQAKLLRVLEQRELMPVGAVAATPVDVRVVCATHQDLTARIKRGAFRGDLYARLAELLIRLPTLRDRREDVLPLLTSFLPSTPAPALTVPLCEALLLHPWPFNVRELKKLAAELSLHAARPWDLEVLADRLQETAALVDDDEDAGASAAPSAPAAEVARPAATPPRDVVEDLLLRHAGNIVQMAKETGRSRKSVYRWIEHHGLDAAAYRAGGT